MWRIEYNPANSILTLRLRDHVSLADLEQMAQPYAEALGATGAATFKVFFDLRGLFPPDTQAVTYIGAFKQLAIEVKGCQGCAVLADSPTVVLQQRRTRVTAGEQAITQLVTLDAEEARRFLLR